MNEEEADYCTSNYLQEFRKCPDNLTGLDSYRADLWKKSLPDKYKHLNYEIYELWLKLRYEFMEMSNELLEMLINLRKNYLLAIITNGPSSAQWEKIHKLDLTSMFDCILVSADLPWEKPNPLIFQTACNYLAVSASKCVMIGDQLKTDIKGSIEANLGCSILLPLSNDSANNKEIQPDFVIKSIYELKSMFLLDEPTSLKPSLSRPLKLKGAASTSSVLASTSSKPYTSKGCFSKTKSTSPYQKRFLSPPDIEMENSNSNASDGS